MRTQLSVHQITLNECLDFFASIWLDLQCFMLSFSSIHSEKIAI
ncbi:hypothetical protein PTUN_a1149 [Pseudoalteromonas tunicata]|nr:hypothetical protein PTUN_a1149 [Pseudoalteromonas tunicata]